MRGVPSVARRIVQLDGAPALAYLHGEFLCVAQTGVLFTRKGGNVDDLAKLPDAMKSADLLKSGFHKD